MRCIVLPLCIGIFNLYSNYQIFVSLLIAKTNDTQETTTKSILPKKKNLKELLSNQCGRRLVTVPKSMRMVQQRIASGFKTERGDHPWQVSIV